MKRRAMPFNITMIAFVTVSGLFSSAYAEAWDKVVFVERKP